MRGPLVTTYVLRARRKERRFRGGEALNAGTLEMEDYTNFNYNARLVAGNAGFSYIQVLEGVMATDLFLQTLVLWAKINIASSSVPIREKII